MIIVRIMMIVIIIITNITNINNLRITMINKSKQNIKQRNEAGRRLAPGLARLARLAAQATPSLPTEILPAKIR